MGGFSNGGGGGGKSPDGGMASQVPSPYDSGKAQGMQYGSQYGPMDRGMTSTMTPYIAPPPTSGDSPPIPPQPPAGTGLPPPYIAPPPTSGDSPPIPPQPPAGTGQNGEAPGSFNYRTDTNRPIWGNGPTGAFGGGGLLGGGLLGGMAQPSYQPPEVSFPFTPEGDLKQPQMPIDSGMYPSKFNRMRPY